MTIHLLTMIQKDRGGDRMLRGAAVTSLGLLGGERAHGAILESLKKRENRDLRLPLAYAVGIRGDPSDVPHLLPLLDDWKASQFVIGSVALALGRIGGEEALPKLLEILEPEEVNGRYPDLARAMVTIALGRLASPDGRSPLDRLSDDFPYYASVPALDEILTIL
jgi:HEAT repeat protein